MYVLKKLTLYSLSFLIMLSCIGQVAHGASDGGRTAADFLLIGTSARSAGMGGAYSAVSTGASATFWNPAGMTELATGEVLLGHFSWFQDINIEHGAVAYQPSERVSIGAQIGFLDYGLIDGRDENGLSTGNLSAYDLYAGLSAGYEINSDFSVGITAKVINQNLDNVSATGFAADIGTKYVYSKFTFAAVATNIRPSMDFNGVSEPLPSMVRVGVAGRPFNDDFLTSIEFSKQFQGETVFRHGLEYGFSDQYFIRTGYSFYPSSESRAFGSGITMGAGVKFTRAEINYAFTAHDEYAGEDLHRFSLTFKLGQ